MKVTSLLEIIGADFYTGVPDSQLKALCDYLMNEYGIDAKHHIIAANEGNCTALAAGYHMATGKIPVVYMQNSGQGNIINPVASLLNEQVYAIPVIFIIGWRGEPGVHDEPQHIFQGEVTRILMDTIGISSFVIGKETTEREVCTAMDEFRELLNSGKSVAFIVRKGALEYKEKITYHNQYAMNREIVIQHITEISKEDPVISTTGKASRELFETRADREQSHKYDFLSVGSMGHCSSIALGVALNKPNAKVWCVDGDGAVLMHMGSMAVIGSNNPKNLVHIVINNGAHETVGGMPTVAGSVDFAGVAKACGYPYAVRVKTYEDLDRELVLAKERNQLTLIEVQCGIGARENLGRPTTKAIENKQEFMKYLKTIS